MKKQAKTILSSLLAVMLATAFFSCALSEDTYPKMNIDYAKRSDGSSYAIYNGEAQEFFCVAEGRENAVDVTVKRESGSLRIIICREDDPDAVIYDGHDFPVEHFTVTAKEPGRYRILVCARDFIGSYKFSYDMQQ